MTDTDTTAPVDPRAQRSREAMLNAIMQLITEEGVGAVSHQRVADRAAVGRATVYRHWPTREAMVIAVFEQFRFPLETPPSLPAEERVFHILTWMARQFARREVRAFILSLTDLAARDPVANAIRMQRMDELYAGLSTILRDSGLQADHTRELMARLIGPIWFRVLVQGFPAEDAFVRATITDALRGRRHPEAVDDTLVAQEKSEE